MWTTRQSIALRIAAIVLLAIAILWMYNTFVLQHRLHLWPYFLTASVLASLLSWGLFRCALFAAFVLVLLSIAVFGVALSIQIRLEMVNPFLVAVAGLSVFYAMFLGPTIVRALTMRWSGP